ncbi:type II toxin-antitoxin system prevent-host-death family antitoxin [Chrysiogenes arsenatis]|uniref:type II toxin-antitoxin system prevent-host-death family antitoxin n=1 Tax=Chrysiogenes arsenatis TaxID=309797 RepID=UPI0004287D22
MQVVSFTEARNNLKSIFDAVYCDHDEVIIHRKGKENVVIIPFDEYRSMKETQYLLSGTKNRERLLVSLEKVRCGKGFERDVVNESALD